MAAVSTGESLSRPFRRHHERTYGTVLSLARSSSDWPGATRNQELEFPLRGRFATTVERIESESRAGSSGCLHGAIRLREEHAREIAAGHVPAQRGSDHY